MMNRKEIVGWNFKAGDMVTVGYNFSEEMIYFRLRKEKNKTQEFMMALTTEDSKDKEFVRKIVAEQGLKIVVLLQNVGDQITLI
jgi:hypothetical protein